jgi:tripartite-type tricarboxylate transporter receptor subunit TctC
VPAATPDAVVAQLNAAVGKTLAHPATVEHYGRLGLSVPDAAERTPQGATALMRSELVRWRQVLEAAGVRPAGEI